MPKLKSAENLVTRFICYAIVGWLYEVILWIFEQHQIMKSEQERAKPSIHAERRLRQSIH